MPSSRRTGLKERLWAVALGALSAAILLEIGLLLVGAAFLRLQEHSNRLTLQHPGTYRVLCLGDSMTAGTYPRYLEEILNSRGKGRRFSVIDKARYGTTSRYTVETLPDPLAEYHPDMVVVMMGCNDSGEILLYGGLPASGGFSLKTLRLAGFLRYLITQRWPSHRRPMPVPAAPAPSSPDSNSTADRPTPQEAAVDPIAAAGRDLLNEGQTYAAMEVFARALRRFPEAPELLMGLGDCYTFLGEDRRPRELFKKAARSTSPRLRYAALLHLGSHDRRHRRFQAAEDAVRQAIRLEPQQSAAYQELGLIYIFKNNGGQASLEYATWAFEQAVARGNGDSSSYELLGTHYLRLHDYAKAEQAFQRAVALNPNDARAYGGLVTCYGATGRAKLEREALGKANALREHRYVAMTRDNYRRVRQLVKDSGALLVCVQYPRRGVKEIKNLFDDPAGILFVDNEGPFNQALRAAPLTDYFVDFFAGDFGHCTEKGYRLLAEDIAQVILKALPRP